ncbi:mCG1030143, partial [Mus musculus]
GKRTALAWESLSGCSRRHALTSEVQVISLARILISWTFSSHSEQIS